MSSHLHDARIHVGLQVASTPFKRISYTEAIDLLLGVVAEGKKSFEFKVEWGIDLSTEHERYLTEEIFKQPVIVYNYPKEIKAFYMRLNDDNKTVAAMDVLVPKVGRGLVAGRKGETGSVERTDGEMAWRWGVLARVVGRQCHCCRPLLCIATVSSLRPKPGGYLPSSKT
mgnify:CR=1 FL=1